MNGFSTEGTRAIGIALTLNKYLEHLDLSFNRVSNNAAADFARYFKINTTLKTVKVCSTIACTVTVRHSDKRPRNRGFRLELSALGLELCYFGSKFICILLSKVFAFYADFLEIVTWMLCILLS